MLTSQDQTGDPLGYDISPVYARRGGRANRGSMQVTVAVPATAPIPTGLPPADNNQDVRDTVFDEVVERLRTVLVAVSYTHLTLPTICSV